MTARDFHDLLADRILVLDGAMGTQLQAANLTANDFGGEALLGCNEALNLSRPDVIAHIHHAYFAAGADMVETNTFGATPLVLDEYGLGAQALAINEKAAALAVEVARSFTDRRRYVAGSMGPTTRSLSVTGGVTFDALCEHYAVQAMGLIRGGVDVLLLETGLDTLNMKAGLIGIDRASAELSQFVPVMLSCTMEQTGTMLGGQTADAFLASVEHAARRKGGLVSVGINCATGPDPMADHVRALSDGAPFATSCMPNAGLPDENGRYGETPASLAHKLGRFLDHGQLNLIGGCCGTTPAHIAALAEAAAAHRPRPMQARRRAWVAGTEMLDLDDARPVIVGERTNVIGSRAFKRLITEGRFDEAAEVGRKQVRGGAHIIDVCLANPDRDENTDMQALLSQLVKKVRAPIMIDSTDAAVIETALKLCQGKAIINSINLEDGRERFDAVVPLMHRYGAAVVVGCIDEDPTQGMAVTRTRKVEIAGRSLDLLTREYGIEPEDVIFDALVFPVGTGDEQYIGSAVETIEGIRLIKQAFPRCRTILGISNVSFGLPESGREALNTVFLHRCLEAGLDLAIVNAEKLERITHLPKEDIAICERLLLCGKDDYQAALTAFAGHFSADKAKSSRVVVKKATAELRVADNVIEGSKDGLTADLDELCTRLTPLEIINGPLMVGMAEVGRLFGLNQLIVAEVLQSAEVMKAAVAHLEPRMTKNSDAVKGKVLLATVKGDVHDIGKNLVEIILSNNGFEVINLGIKVPPADIVKAQQQHHADMIGLSGLLVKSAHEMVATVEELQAQGINVPVLVGGAALSERFTTLKIGKAYGGVVAYAKDAMAGLDLANAAVSRDADGGRGRVLAERIAARTVEVEASVAAAAAAAETPIVVPTMAPVLITHDDRPPMPPDTALHVLGDVPLETVWPYINPMMLYTRHLGLKGRIDDLIEKGDEKAKALKATVTALENEVLKDNLLVARAMYRYVRAYAEGDTLVLSDSGNEYRLAMPRQTSGERRCLADLVPQKETGKVEHVGVFVTSCQGRQTSVRQQTEALKQAGSFVKMHALAALAIETAEATAEWLHQRMRTLWGIADAPATTPRDLFSARYRGRRYSFGYPACPNLADQTHLFELLKPEQHIGVALTEGFMMDPEASVSALVFHHPQAVYFSTGSDELG